jgi:undecaprenyl phosphate-alpha-L-ara4N flippase subunit ArnE
VTHTWLGIVLIVICAAIEGTAQLAWKMSTRQPSRRVMWIGGGCVLAAVEICLYTFALTLLDVTIAFAMGSLSFVAIAILSWLFLKERISAVRAIGLLLILCGVALMAGQA